MNLCIGTANFQRGYGKDISYDECKKVLQLAYRNKVCYIDTAQSYEGVELMLKDMNVLGSFKVITKLSIHYKHKDFDSLLKVMRGTLTNYKHIHGLLIHGEHLYTDKLFKDMIKFRGEGFCDKIGISLYDSDRAIDCAIEPAMDIIQVPFNVLDRRLIDNGFFQLASDTKKDVFVRSVFLKGVLLMTSAQILENNYTHLIKPLMRFNNYVYYKNMKPDFFALKCICSKIRELHPSTTIILGIDNAEQLKRNLQLIYLTKLPQEIIREWWNNLPRYEDKVLNPSKWK